MKTWHLVRTAAAAGVLLFPFSLCATRAQDRPPLRTSVSASRPTPDEEFLFAAANRERATAGVPALKWDAALAAAARGHAEIMARNTLLSHQYPGEPTMAQRAAAAGAKFAMVAENVAMGDSAEGIHDGWMHSPGHRKNILNPELTTLGIAVVGAHGRLFAVQDFSRSVAGLSLEEQEEKVIALLAETAQVSAVATQDARRACSADDGSAGAPFLYVSRFEVTDLSKLPDELLHTIKSRGYRKASVGACPDNDSEGFTRYRLAVLLH